jgi:hypothetical protein
MVKTTSGLFVSASENLVTGILLFLFLSGFMTVVTPSDFSPSMRGVLISQLVLLILTALFLLVAALMSRTRYIVGDNSASERARQQQQAEEDEGTKENDEGSAPSQEALAASSMLDWIMATRLRFLLSLGAANAYSTFTLGLLLMFMCAVIQSSTGWGLDATLDVRMDPESSFQAVDQNWRQWANISSSQRQGSVYASSRRLDWIQATMGSSGWIKSSAVQVRNMCSQYNYD